MIPAPSSSTAETAPALFRHNLRHTAVTKSSVCWASKFVCANRLTKSAPFLPAGRPCARAALYRAPGRETFRGQIDHHGHDACAIEVLLESLDVFDAVLDHRDARARPEAFGNQSAAASLS